VTPGRIALSIIDSASPSLDPPSFLDASRYCQLTSLLQHLAPSCSTFHSHAKSSLSKSNEVMNKGHGQGNARRSGEQPELGQARPLRCVPCERKPIALTCRDVTGPPRLHQLGSSMDPHGPLPLLAPCRKLYGVKSSRDSVSQGAWVEPCRLRGEPTWHTLHDGVSGVIM
jgi:hypothetical protein